MTSTSKMQHQQNGESRTRGWRHAWPLERILFAMAGTVTLLSAALAATVSPWFLVLTAFVGVSQWSYVVTGACPASLVLERLGARRGVV
jgi:hypothetical protein